MVLAYVLIVAEAGSEKNISEELSETDGVEEVDVIYGEYDLIAKIKVDEISQLGDFIMEKVRPIEGVKRTSTLIAVE